MLKLLVKLVSFPLLVFRNHESASNGSVSAYYALEQSTSDMDTVQRWLRDHDIDPDTSTQGGGGGMLWSVDRLVVDVGGQGAGSDDTETGSFGYGVGHVSAGIALYNGRWLRIYPLVGIGGMGAGLERTADDEAEAESSGWGTMLVNGGLGLDFTLRLWRIGLVVGLRMGFYAGLVGALETEEQPSGPFFRVIVGPRLFL